VSSFTIQAADARLYIALFGSGFAATWLILLWEGQRRRWPTGLWLTMLAWTFTCAMVGSHLAMLGSNDWAAALSHGSIPHTTDKSFLGMVAGGIVGVATSRRLLRLPLAVGDAFALALPVGLFVGRVGCLLRGCCFGTPTNLPWAISYSPGSLAQGLQVQRGLVAPTSASLPVHPVQAYEMLLLLGVIALLLMARRRLRHELSLFLLYAVLQSLVRFAIEFVREAPLVARVAGIKPVQIVLLGAAAAAAVLLWFCERGIFRVSVRTAPSFARQTLTLAGVGAITLPFSGWFTEFELAILFAVAAPALFALALAAVHSARRAPARWVATGITVGSLVLLGAASDDLFPPEISEPNYWTVTGAAGGGECAESGYYGAVSGTVAYTHEFSKYANVRVGGDAVIPLPWVQASGGGIFGDGSTRWFGLGGGVSACAFGVGPFARIRLGPSDIVWLEGSYGDSLNVLFSRSQVSAGMGVRLSDHVRLQGGYMTIPGWEYSYNSGSGGGGYLGGTMDLGEGRWFFASAYAVPRASCWQLMLGVRYPLGGWSY
jgi:prolipoprotein diacylglyceryltransferase